MSYMAKSWLGRRMMNVSNTKTTEYTVLSWEIILPYKTWFIPELEGIKCLQPERVLIIPSI